MSRWKKLSRAARATDRIEGGMRSALTVARKISSMSVNGPDVLDERPDKKRPEGRQLLYFFAREEGMTVGELLKVVKPAPEASEAPGGSSVPPTRRQVTDPIEPDVDDLDLEDEDDDAS